MARVRTANTTPEIALRRELWKLGLRYRLQVSLPGRPDIVFTAARVAVFVDGCFWHRCPKHGTSPKRNYQFWAAKLAANVARDRRVDEALRRLGWKVVRVWEHSVEAEPPDTARRIARVVGRRSISERRGRTASTSRTRVGE